MIPVLIHLRCIHQQMLMAQFHGVHIKRFGNGERSGGSDSLFDPAMRQCVQDEFHSVGCNSKSWMGPLA